LDQFFNTNVSQYSDTFECGGIFNFHLIATLLLSPLVKQMKIGQHLAKLRAGVESPVFLTHRVV